jgi:hypothetical protein
LTVRTVRRLHYDSAKAALSSNSNKRGTPMEEGVSKEDQSNGESTYSTTGSSSTSTEPLPGRLLLLNTGPSGSLHKYSRASHFYVG